ncbi:hypothetical protein C8Q76DRAFT_793699 [Earliella scabrosa]|nr:hypothetical protein C8Q76DRAFT_793699 [Earliella scabrosa]
MSLDAEQAQLDALYDQSQWYLQTAAATLLAYEYIITFDREVKLFWNRKVTMASILFGVNRYLALLVAMLFIPYDLPGPGTAYAVGLAGGHVVVDEFGCDWIDGFQIATGVMCATFICSLNEFMRLTKVGTGYRLTIAIRASLIAADIIILSVTWIKTYRDREQSVAIKQPSSLSGILFRDGLIYFLVLFSTHILHLGLVLHSLAGTSDQAINMILVSETITAILISRFLMDLQEASNHSKHQEFLSSFGSHHMSHFIGSLGSSLPAPGLVNHSVHVPIHSIQYDLDS